MQVLIFGLVVLGAGLILAIHGEWALSAVEWVLGLSFVTAAIVRMSARGD